MWITALVSNSNDLGGGEGRGRGGDGRGWEDFDFNVIVSILYHNSSGITVHRPLIFSLYEWIKI